MRVVFASLLSLIISSQVALAVEVTSPNEAATPQHAPPITASIHPAVAVQKLQAVTANKPGIMPVAATAGQMIVEGDKPLTAEQIAKNKALQDAKVKSLVKDQATRLQQLEKANLDALSQNQELQLKNDSLGVQVQVLQSERSAQMFLYGAATIAVGVLLGFLIASYVYTKRRRQW